MAGYVTRCACVLLLRQRGRCTHPNLSLYVHYLDCRVANKKCTLAVHGTQMGEGDYTAVRSLELKYNAVMFICIFGTPKMYYAQVICAVW